MSFLGKRNQTTDKEESNTDHVHHAAPPLKKQKLHDTKTEPTMIEDAPTIVPTNTSATDDRKVRDSRKQPPKKGSRIEKLPSYYFFLNGYRYIAPYDFEYRCFAKGRWFKRNIFDVMSNEFLAYDANYYKQAIESGRVLVRGERVGLDYVVRNGDWISHRTHRHEPAVLHRKIEIVQETDEIVVVNKPCGMTIHPSGAYRYNTLIYILYSEFDRLLFCAHRLDRVTSGLLLLCKTHDAAKRLSEKIRDRDVSKTYLARVKGRFPSKEISNFSGKVNVEEKVDESKSEDSERITVHQPIRCIDPKRGVHEIHELGKDAVTEFKFVSYNAESDSSVVECYPHTGRTHQIRLHLQFLGHPIVNDFAYGGKECHSTHWIPTDEKEKQRLVGELQKNWSDGCDECQSKLKAVRGEVDGGEIKNSAAEIYLHALKYECDDFAYSVPRPAWA